MLLPLSTSSTAMLMLTFCLLLDIYGCLAEDPTTFTPSDLKSFEDPNSRYYRHLVIDSSADNLYVGAMEYVFRLDATDIGQGYTKSQKLNPVSGEETKCLKKGKNKEFDCKNHVRSIIVHPDKVVVCGTGAYHPRTFSLNKTSLYVIEAGNGGSGIAHCPFDPNDNATYIYIEKGNPDDIPSLYSATVTDFAKSDPIIYRPKLRKNNVVKYDLLRNLPQDRKWLNEANFVGSFDMDDYVYFFFRESAVEYMNCGKAVYARVARVCKIDKGGRSVLEKKWTTYVKARLNCSLPGEYPFYFNELYDVYRKDGLFYGIFTTTQNGLFGSAVCAFNRAQIDAAFDSNFKEQLDTKYNWLKVPQSQVPTPRPGSCANDTRNQPDNVLQFIKTHPLMDSSVKQKRGHPMFHQGNIIFRNIAVDVVKEYKIFFLGTNRGEVYKVVHWDDVTGKHHSHTVAIWKPFGNTVNPIWQMKLYRKQLYLGTDEKVVQFPIEQCEAYKLCSDCVKDPYCGWDVNQHRCTNSDTGLLQGVDETDPSRFCDNYCTAKSYQTSVRLQGDPVYLKCSSPCSVAPSVQWYRGNHRLTIDYRKYFLTDNQGLIIMNVTSVDGATYRCKSGMMLRTEHIVHITPCSDPTCYFEEEFRNWCTAFDQYKQDYNHWRCLKDTCIGDERCVPTNVATTCKRP